MADRHFFYVVPQHVSLNRFTLTSTESHHALHVLRLAKDSEIWLIDGVGMGYKAKISEIAQSMVSGNIIESIPGLGENRNKITLAIGNIRRERLEWAIEKAVELGVNSVEILNLNRSVQRKVNRQRLETKIVAAAKQCGRSWFPPVTIQDDLTQWLNSSGGTCLVCHSGPQIREVLRSDSVLTETNYTILVGPEGDFTPEEYTQIIQSGFRSVSLGPRRLRSETAAISAISILADLIS